MRLELPQPSTVLVTVFIVMQTQSGQVFAKSFYRIVGTLVGLSVMVTLIALFARGARAVPRSAWRSGSVCAPPGPRATVISAATPACSPATPRR
ncbi:FUSC family protein [Pseudomonas aeruginosa]